MHIIPEKIILGKKPTGNQGYLVFSKPDGSTKNEARFKKWVSEERGGKISNIENEALSGFSIISTVGGNGGYDKRQAYVQIKDPRGFIIEITDENFIEQKEIFEEPDQKPKGIRMNGRGVYTFVAKILPHYVENLVEKSGMKADDIDYLIPHQANIRIIQAVQERLGYPDEKVVTNIKYYGNTSAASIPIALAESVEKGNVKLGSTAILCGFGAGMTWGGAIVRLREGIC